MASFICDLKGWLFKDRCGKCPSAIPEFQCSWGGGRRIKEFCVTLLHTEFGASLGYMRPSFMKKKIFFLINLFFVKTDDSWGQDTIVGSDSSSPLLETWSRDQALAGAGSLSSFTHKSRSHAREKRVMTRAILFPIYFVRIQTLNLYLFMYVTKCWARLTGGWYWFVD